MFAFVHKVFAHRAAGIGSDELQRAGLGSCRRYDDGIVHGAAFLQLGNQIGNCGTLLADGYVNTDNILISLVQDRIDRDGSLTGLTVADDQLTLSASDRDHGVDSLDAGLQRLFNGLAGNDAGRYGLYRPELCRIDRTVAINGLADRVDNTADHSLSHRHRYDSARALDGLSFTDPLVSTEKHDGNTVFFQVLCHSEGAVLKLQQLAGHTACQAAGSGNTVTDSQDCACFCLFDRILIVFDLAPDDLGYLFRF